MRLGFIGLGRMGSNMVFKLLEHGHEIVVWNRSETAVADLKLRITNHSQRGELWENITVSPSIQDLVSHLPSPKIVWSMLPQGAVTEQILQTVIQYLSPNDIVIDGSNAHFKETQRRYEELQAKNIRFLGIGVAGGIIGPKAGYCMMAGGDKSAYGYIKPLLDSLVLPSAAHGYFGEGGAGHFVKMIHNGIEYGIMQSLSEGFAVLENAPFAYDLHAIGQVWQKSSLVSGFMLDRAVEALAEDPHLEKLSGQIDATGEAEWTIEQAKEEGVSVSSIELALDYRKKSKTDPAISKSFTARMIAALRNKFGGHKVLPWLHNKTSIR